MEAVAAHGGAMQRLATATEANRERRLDLLQDMHVALWRSFASFDGRCSVRTWVYRVAHNVAASHVDRERRSRAPLVTLDEIEEIADLVKLDDGTHCKEAHDIAAQKLDTVRARLRDLKSIGAHNAAQGRRRGLEGKSFLRNLEQRYEQFRSDGKLPATFEVVYAHAWKGQERLPDGAVPIRIHRRK